MNEYEWNILPGLIYSYLYTFLNGGTHVKNWLSVKYEKVIYPWMLILKFVRLTSQLNHPHETPHFSASTLLLSQPSNTSPTFCSEEKQPWRAGYSREGAGKRNVQTNQELPMPQQALHFHAVDNLQKAKQLNICTVRSPKSYAKIVLPIRQERHTFFASIHASQVLAAGSTNQ
jgi:hypothetical protein